MTAAERATGSRIGRPPKIDEHGTPTRERLLRAAVDACVEFGYDGATLADIARRAGVSTPAVYSHFSGKAGAARRGEQARAGRHRHHSPARRGRRPRDRLHWLQPDFKPTRILVAELHCAAIRQPEVAELLEAWQHENAERLQAARRPHRHPGPDVLPAAGRACRTPTRSACSG